MNYLSVCSGIEAFTVAMRGTGAKAVAYCEFDKFPSAVLAHHWNDTPNLGDMTKWLAWPESMFLEIDTLVGGTPCQAFSIAGLRNSLADARGNLTLTYVQILDHIDEIRARDGRPPAVCLWENVPGVLNTDDNAFGCFLAALAGESEPLQPPGGRWTDAGYVRGPRRAIAWRSLDAQYFGLAQRRQRVFVVASAREGFRPEEVLFESEGVRRDSPPRRGEGEGTTHDIAPCIGASGRGFAMGGGTRGQDPVIAEVLCMATGQAGAEIGIGIGTTLNCNHEAPIVTQEIYPTLDAQMDRKWGSNQWVNNGFAVIEPAIVCVHGTQDPCTDENLAFALGRNSGQENAIAFDTTQITSKANYSNPKPGDPCHPLATGAHAPAIATTKAVRRLMPVECARLQGFPDHHTDIQPKGKPTPDGPQYKAYGNSMAVPVMRWIGKRLLKHLESSK